MKQMRLHLEQEHAVEFERFAVQERARMRDSFTSFLQATMGLSEDKSFVLPDGSTAEMKPGMMPDLRAHFQELLEKDQAGELGDDDDEAMAEGLFGQGDEMGDLMAELQRLRAQEGNLLDGLDQGQELGGLGGLGGLLGGMGGLGGIGGGLGGGRGGGARAEPRREVPSGPEKEIGC